jgi:hypothetical protein
MDKPIDKSSGRNDRNLHATEVLRRLHDIGAINLDVLLTKSKEIGGIVGIAGLDPEDGICYPFMIRIGPKHDIDLVSVATELQQLGFDIKRLGASK